MNRASLCLLVLAILLTALVAFGLGRGSSGHRAQPEQDLIGNQPVLQTSQSDGALTGSIALPVTPTLNANAADCAKPYGHFDGPISLLTLPSDFEQTVGLYTLVSQADLPTLERYLNEARDISSQSDRHASVHIIFQRLVELSAEDAISRAQTLPSDLRDQILFNLFTGLAKHDLDEAIRQADMMPAHRREWFQTALLRPFQDNPETTRYILEQMGVNSVTAGHTVYRPDPVLLAQARTDPSAALAVAMELTNSITRQQTVQSIGQSWATLDPDQALAAIGSLPAGQLANQFRDGVLAIVARSNPERALSYLASNSADSRAWGVLYQAIPALAANDPRRALRIARDLSPPHIRAQALSLAISTWAQSDLDAAVAALDSLDSLSSAERTSLANGLSQTLTALDPTAALALAERIEGYKGDAWLQVVATIAQADAAEAMELVAKLDDSPRKTLAMSQLINTIAYVDPAAAIAHVDVLPPGQYRTMALQQIASQWANNDTVAALDWVLSLPARDQGQALQSVGYQLAQADPTLAMAYTDQIAHPVAQANWIASIVSASQHDTRRLLAWLEDYTDRPQYPQWLAQIVANAATRPDGVDTALGLLAKIDDTEQYQMASQQLAANWAQQDPREAARWFNRLSSEERSQGALTAIVTAWRNHQPRAAQRWVLNLRATTERDAGLVALIGYDNALDWNQTRALIEKISQPTVRDDAYSSQIRQMASYDLELARQMLEQSAIAAEQHAYLDQYLAGLEADAG